MNSLGFNKIRKKIMPLEEKIIKFNVSKLCYIDNKRVERKSD